MTAPQRKVLDFLTAYIECERISPSLREIAAGCGYSSPATVHKILQNLKFRRLIEFDHNSTRSIRIPQRSITNCANCAALRSELKRAYETIHKLRSERNISNGA